MKYLMRDRSGERDRVTGYSLDAMATRMFGRRCKVFGDIGWEDPAIFTVVLWNGTVIGEVCIHKENNR